MPKNCFDVSSCATCFLYHYENYSPVSLKLFSGFPVIYFEIYIQASIKISRRYITKGIKREVHNLENEGQTEGGVLYVLYVSQLFCFVLNTLSSKVKQLIHVLGCVLGLDFNIQNQSLKSCQRLRHLVYMDQSQ